MKIFSAAMISRGEWGECLAREGKILGTLADEQNDLVYILQIHWQKIKLKLTKYILQFT